MLIYILTDSALQIHDVKASPVKLCAYASPLLWHTYPFCSLAASFFVTIQIWQSEALEVSQLLYSLSTFSLKKQKRHATHM